MFGFSARYFCLLAVGWLAGVLRPQCALPKIATVLMETRRVNTFLAVNFIICRVKCMTESV